MMLTLQEAKEICKQGDLFYFSENPDYESAFRCYQKAAIIEYKEALYKIANCYELGKGVQIDFFKAMDYYQKAADQGYPSAITKIDYFNSLKKNKKKLYEMAFLSCFEEHNYTKAVYWFDFLAKQNYKLAVNQLGYCYLKGWGVEKSEIKAIELFIQASKKSCPEAWYHLGLCYEMGYGLEKNVSKALVLYEKAVTAITSSLQFISYQIIKFLFTYRYQMDQNENKTQNKTFNDYLVEFYENKFKAMDEDTMYINNVKNKEGLEIETFHGAGMAWYKLGKSLENDENALPEENILCYFESAMHGNKEAQHLVLNYIYNDQEIDRHNFSSEGTLKPCMKKWLSKKPIQTKIIKHLQRLKMLSELLDLNDDEIFQKINIKKNKTKA